MDSPTADRGGCRLGAQVLSLAPGLSPYTACLHAVTKLERWLIDCEAEKKFVLHHRTDNQLCEIAKPISIALLIGPEGGLSQEEIEHAIANGFKALALGPRVLRTETAPLAAISILQHRWGDM